MTRLLLQLLPFAAILTACSPFTRRTLREPSPESGRWVQVWTIDNVDVVARSDGWVEVIPAFQSNVYRARAGYLMPRERFSPDQVTAWVNGSRSATRGALEAAPKLGAWQLQLKQGGRGWTVAPNSNCIEGNLTVESLEPPMRLLSTFDSAATLARHLRPTPSTLIDNAPFDRKDVACEARAEQQLNFMPRDPARSATDAEFSIFRETIARFVVAASGHADTNTLQFIPALTPELEVAARQTIASWSFTGAVLSGKKVAQWVHTPLVFVDSTHYASRESLAAILSRNWRARADGLVEWHDPARPDIHEVFSPTEILDWLIDFEQLRASAPTSGHIIRETMTPSGTPPKSTSAWIRLIGARGENRMAANLFWSRTDSVPRVRVALSLARCGDDTLRTIASDLSADDQFTLARSAALLARQRRAAAPFVDTVRIYGSFDVTCQSRRAGDPIDIAMQDEAIRQRLNLGREALAHMTVDRTGRVTPGSVQLFGKWSGADTRRIAQAIEELRFEPARFAGRRVAQHVSYLVHAVDASVRGSRASIKEVCVSSAGVAARLRVLSPSAGAVRSRLERLALRIAGSARNQRDTIPPTGIMRFVLSPENDVTFFRWISLPENPALGIRMANSTQYWKFDPFILEAVPSYGIEAQLGASCSQM